MDHIRLDPEQLSVLGLFVEASRSVPTAEREPIRLIGADGFNQLIVYHPGVSQSNPPYVYPGDVDTLGEAGLLRVSRHGYHDRTVEITPLGRAYVDQYIAHQLAPVERVVSPPREYVATAEFERAYPGVFAKWSRAEELLLEEDSVRHLSTIGHLCREAMQLFVDALARQLSIDLTSDLSKTVARMKVILTKLSIGAARTAFLEAQLAYWGAVSDLVQRQEHGAAKEGEGLDREDGRRVVLHTLLVMYEWHRSADKASSRRAAT
jgi:hypothetical protein